MDMDVNMLFLTSLICFNPYVFGLFEDINIEDDLCPDLTDFDLDISPHRVPRQVKAMLTKETKPHIQELSVKTTIISRYAFTAVSCTMLNRHSAAAEGVFQFPIPKNAYVSNFTMIIGGRVYPSEVRPKEKKVKQGKGGEAKPKNKETGEQSEPEVEVFRMGASIPGRNRAMFMLTYEELLQRRLGRYEHVTSLRPLQLVSRLSVDITIVDHSTITHLEVLPLRNGKSNTAVASGASAAKTPAKPALPVSTVIKQNKTFCRITFSPNIVQQAKITTSGILGEFVVHYDVERELGIGDIQVLNGHFVHYFAPKDLPVVPKNVVFVIDTSASMLGTKIRQTKDALFTILRDLRPGDRFNFVSFSNRIKVWQPNRLVPVTPLNVRDAKKFIYMLQPTGGTDINGGIQTGSSLLSGHLNADPDANHNSVSLIIFLTDGRPTVGELQSPSILSNARAAVKEQFCVFTIGMGNDVDYRLLERMALENCGMMRRIHEDSDASTSLKGFYDEIGTPLLSDIRVNYTEDSVQYVTQHLFTNYFNGSEIVIAGKLTNQSADSLHVQVTASNSDKSIILETDVALRQREVETERHVKEAAAGVGSGVTGAGTTGSVLDDFVERVWGFLSVKEGLRSRLKSQTSREREGHTQQATDLSLAYHFLTPLTSLVVEKPQVLADGTMAEDTPTPTPVTTETDKKAASANELSDETEGEENKAQSLHLKKDQPGGQSSTVTKTTDKIVKRPAQKSVTISKTSADGDPHFVVEFPLSKLTVCFNINGEPGHILRMVSDHKHSGVTVNGKLIGAPAPAGSHKQQRTYFSTITIVVNQPKRAYIEVTPKKVILDGRDRLVLPCDTTVSVESGGLAVAIVGKSNVTVTIGGTISFVILVHQYKNPAPYQRDHLGFYISNSKGLSHDCHGLLGQFLYEDVGLAELPGNATTTGHNSASSRSPILKVKGRSVPVVQKTRRIYSGRQSVDCWFARNNAAKLIDGQYEDYVVSHLFDTGDWPHGSNGA
ncbi:inter-alpha-trypsin inhibitor heavy chain H5-like isoform X2 [Coregonus clupeaformis]|uniref:inter-alpha-trypsin inhibitor heavy chain H5-like isoform X2 n=1 Tax=Coregonus clupeaformis TaxID=59861 RepID=UPI001E1C48C2|nr:inter-alpha-trypsin inhibitor heavy chain H5-like isoform X2 [Coregonus clupeaformis]